MMSDPARRALERVDIGIVVAIAIEASAIVERLDGPFELRAGDRRVSVGRLGKATVAVMTAGVGADAAVRGTRLLVAGHRPSRIVAAGLCGGLAPALPRNAIVIADRVGLSPTPASAGPASHAEDGFRAVEPLPRDWETQPVSRAARGPMVTSDTVVATVEAKRALHEATGAVAVDMESWWIADEAGRAGLPVHVVRAVCDTATEAVPVDVASLAVAPTAARMAGAAVRLLWHRPSAALDLVELRERAHSAAEALALHLEAMLGGNGTPGAAGTRSA